MKKIVRLGTRGSPLALIQAQMVRDEMYRAQPGLKESCDIEIVPIRTSGDWLPGQKEPVSVEIGVSKGLFTKEIEEALLSGTLDCAVHSMKDVSVNMVAGLAFGAIMKRADPRDALLSPIAPTLQDLPKGARVGTSSVRRKAQILALRPDLMVIPFRGNVDTRLKRLAEEEADATLLAVAGLSRLGALQKVASILDKETMLPAAAQGLQGIQIREDDEAMREWVKPVNDRLAEICCLAERAFMSAMGGSCQTPVAALSEVLVDGSLSMDALAARPDGTHLVRKQKIGSSHEAVKLGFELGQMIRAELPEDFFCA